MGGPALGQVAAPDCSQTVLLNDAVRSIERGGVLLEQKPVHAMDPLPRRLLDESTRVSYSIPVTACPVGAYRSLWVYRIGAPYRISANGQPLRSIQPFASADARVYNGRYPALFLLPEGARDIAIEFATIPYLNFGLVRLELGPPEALAVSRAVDTNALTTFNDTSSAVIALVAVLTLGLWLRRRKDWQVLWLSLACMVWALRGLAYQRFAIAIDPLSFESINPWAIFMTCAGTSASALYSLGAMSAWRGRMLAGLAGAISLGFVLSISLQAGGFLIRSLAFVSGFALIIPVTYLLWQQRRKSQRTVPLLLIGYATLLVCAIHDIGMVIGYVPPDHWSLNSLGFTVMLLTYTVSGSQYMVHTLNRAEDTNAELERAIAAKSTQLEASYALLRDSERATARAQEREHLLREMHDGLGAQLMTALRGVERGAMPRELVVQALQDSLDDLRLLMDSTDLGRTLRGALVAWRGRWSPRLSALGVDMHWELDDAIDSVQLSPDAVLQIMRIVQEATVNVIKHAQASEVHLRATCEGGALLLEVSDNGVGLSPDTVRPGARGLANMQARAKLLGAQLSVERRSPQGTVVRLRPP